MNIKRYETNKDGTLKTEEYSSIPDNHRLFEKAMKEVQSGDAEIIPYVTPEPTTEELRQQAMMTGIEFDGVMCSAFKDDAWGLSFVSEFILDGNDTVFEFKNGNTLLLTSSNFASFKSVWLPFRQSCLKLNFTGS